MIPRWLRSWHVYLLAFLILLVAALGLMAVIERTTTHLPTL